MGINITVDEKLLAEAERVTGVQDRSELVQQALQELIRSKSAIQGMLDLAGKVQLRDDYDYKAMRAGDRDRR